MKRFLPTIPAFLFCFIGGRFIGPSPVDASNVLAAVTFMPVRDDRGYEAWKSEMAKMKARKADAELNKRQAADDEAEGEKMNRLLAVVRESQAKFKSGGPGQTWYYASIANPDYKNLEQGKSELDQKKNQLEEMIAGGAGNKDAGYEARAAGYRNYKAAQEKQEGLLKNNARSLREMAGTAP